MLQLRKGRKRGAFHHGTRTDVVLRSPEMAGQEIQHRSEGAGADRRGEAGTQPEDGEKKVYAFVSKTAADPIFLLMFDGYKAACDKLGVEAV